MNILEIAEYVWLHSETFAFGRTESWDPDLFTQSWAETRHPPLIWSTYGPGWYWFRVTMKCAELFAVPKPVTLPKAGCDIGSVSQANTKTFGKNLLCQPDDTGGLVVYNGHEGRVSNRVRGHFALNNDRTGALGLKHFALSREAWEVRVFSTPSLECMQGDEKSQIRVLMNSNIGRRAVETAWRATHGWPLLCLQ